MIRATLTRPILHLARESDAAVEVKRLDYESDAQFAKRCASIRTLGSRWLRHPAYKFIPLHSNNPEVWRPALAQWWTEALDLARADREASAAFKRAQAVRAAVGES